MVPVLLFLHRGPLFQVLLGYPEGRVVGRRRALVIAAYVDGAVLYVGRNGVCTLVLTAAVMVIVFIDYRRAQGSRRRSTLVSTAATLVVCLTLAGVAAAQEIGASPGLKVLYAYDVILMLSACALVVDLLRGNWSEGTVTGLVVDLGTGWEARTLQARLARALGDPSLTIGYWVPEAGQYVDESGGVLILEDVGSDRAISRVDRAGERAAVLVHDPLVLDEPILLEGVAGAVRLALDAVRLQALAHARAQELATSRERILSVAAEQREQLAQELQGGAGRRLALVADHIRSLTSDLAPTEVPEELAKVSTQLAAARSEVSALARGIHPSALTAGGLRAALEELVESFPVPVRLDVQDLAAEPALDRAVYFLCTEALANVAKHAAAASASVSVQRRGATVIVAVADDGRGGASSAAGSGLAGLATRVEELGGTLSVFSPQGAGTRVSAILPWRGLSDA